MQARSGKIFTFVYSKFGLILTVLSVFSIISCTPGEGPHQEADPAGGNLASGQSISYTQIRPIIDKNCIECHGPAAGNLDWTKEANVLASIRSPGKNWTARISGKTMPPANARLVLSEDDRTVLVSYGNGILAGAKTPASGVDAGGATMLVGEPKMDPMAARALYRCALCHGETGQLTPELVENSGGITPNLAGHDHAYIVSRLIRFFTPAEESSPMSSTLLGVVDALRSDLKLEDVTVSDAGLAHLGPKMKVFIDSLATYFSTQSISDAEGAMTERQSKFSEEERASYTAGAKLVASQCLSCHLPRDTGRPRAATPNIFGQPPQYLEGRFEVFNAVPADQKVSAYQGMPATISNLDASQLKSIVLYLSTTEPAKAHR